jgi:hypothetical protein
MNKVGSNVAWMLPVPAGQLLDIRIASEQQMISKPRMMSLTRADRDMVAQDSVKITPLNTLGINKNDSLSYLLYRSENMI